MSKSNIEWTDVTWNPVSGCNKVSAGCENCYAIRMSNRLQSNPKMGNRYKDTVIKTEQGKLNWTGKILMHENVLLLPLKWKTSHRVFVNSMSDLFHEDVPFKFIRLVFGVMAVCKEQTFQILTKRPQRMLEFFEWFERCDPDFQNDPADDIYDLCVDAGIETGCGSAFETEHWPLKNVWLGVSVENQKAAEERIPLLERIPAAVRFLSCEPLLGPINFKGLFSKATLATSLKSKLTHIHWIIAGGESGHGARPMHPDWVRSLRDYCEKYNVPFLFKQWGNFIPNAMPFRDKQHWINKATGWLTGWRRGKDVCIDTAGKPCLIGGDFTVAAYPVFPMWSVGKHKAGRHLDGKEHNEFPIIKK